MAFGRLIIATESGELAEYELAKQTTSIGRQPGNDVVLNAAGISRYHAQIDVDNGQVYLLDLEAVNGTFLNDQQIEAESKHLLNDGDVIAMGDIRLTYIAPKRKLGTGPLALHTTEIETSNVPIRLVMDDPGQSIAPGSQLQLALLIHNKSGVERMFTVDVAGMEPTWIKVNRHEVRLEEDEQTEVLLSVRPPRTSETHPGHYALVVRVAFKDDPSQVVEVTRAIDILGYSGLGMAVKESGSRSGHYYLAVQNQGNEPLSIDFSGYQREDLLRYQFEQAHLTLEPGETAQTTFKVKPAGQLPTSQPLAFAVVAHSLNAAAFSAPLLAYYHQASELTRVTGATWLAGLLSVPVMGFAIVALFVLAGLLVYAGVLPRPSWWPAFLSGEAPEMAVAVTATAETPSATPPPTVIPTPVVEIVSFKGEPATITFGATQFVTFTWDVTGMDKTSDFLIKIGETEGLRISAEQWSTHQLEVPTPLLVSTAGWSETAYTLSVTGVDGIERSSSVKLTITPIKCTLSNGAKITDLPSKDSTVVAAPASKEVVVGGRTADKVWLQVWNLADHNVLGWVETKAVSCPLQPTIDEYIVVQPGP